MRLVPTIACPCQVEKVSLLFGGATSTQMVSIQFWDDPGSSNDPGAPIGLPFDVSPTGADDVLHEVTLGDDVVVNGPFRVGIEFFHDGPPSIARDTDGTITSDRNFICANLGAECVDFAAAHSALPATGSSAPRSSQSPARLGCSPGSYSSQARPRSRLDDPVDTTSGESRNRPRRPEVLRRKPSTA